VTRPLKRSSSATVLADSPSMSLNPVMETLFPVSVSLSYSSSSKKLSSSVFGETISVFCRISVLYHGGIDRLQTCLLFNWSVRVLGQFPPPFLLFSKSGKPFFQLSPFLRQSLRSFLLSIFDHPIRLIIIGCNQISSISTTERYILTSQSIYRLEKFFALVIAQPRQSAAYQAQ
jgi:hypothetical protein